MNIGILKLGARLTWDALDKTGGLGEAKAIIEMLAEVNKINIYTDIKVKENTNPKTNINIHNILGFNNLTDDVLIVLSGNINYFGGIDSPSQTIIYKHINSFKGKVFYVWIDPELYPKQIWNSIEKKEWAPNYKKEDIQIVREDIQIITSIYNKDAAFEKVNKGGVLIKKENIHYFPFEKYILLNTRKLRINKNPIYDLLYTGTYRSGRRQDKMIKFYFGHSKIKSTFLGKTKLDDFTKSYPSPVPTFLPPIEFDNVKKILNQSIASVNIGDKFYEGNILTPRLYECIQFSTVCLVDIDLDPKKSIFTDSILQEFNYVSSKQEVEDKIFQLKNNPEFRKNIIDLQNMTLTFDNVEYLKSFMAIVNG